MNNFKFSKRSLDRMEGVNPVLIDIAKKALSISNIDFGIPEFGGLRSVKDQGYLFSKGLSKADGVKKLSKHQSGYALDVYAYVDGKASWEVEHMAQIACAFLQVANDMNINLQWGGLWKSFVDMPHFELKEDQLLC